MSIIHNCNLIGMYVVLNEDVLDPEWRDMKWRVVKVAGGFGASPKLGGRAIYFGFCDGDSIVQGIGAVERYATGEEIHQFQHNAPDGVGGCKLGLDCPSLEDDQ